MKPASVIIERMSWAVPHYVILHIRDRHRSDFHAIDKCGRIQVIVGIRDAKRNGMELSRAIQSQMDSRPQLSGYLRRSPNEKLWYWVPSMVEVNLDITDFYIGYVDNSTIRE